MLPAHFELRVHHAGQAIPTCGFGQTTDPSYLECHDTAWWRWLKGWVLPLGAGLGVGYAIYRYVGFAYIPVPILAGIVTAFFVSISLDPGQGLP